MAATGLEAFLDPMATAQQIASQNQLQGTIYQTDAQKWIAYLNALAGMQQQGIVNTGQLDVTKQQGTNSLNTVNAQGGFDLQRQGLANQGNVDVTKLQGLNAQQLQQLVNSGLIDQTKLQGQNALSLAGVNNKSALDQILAQTGASKDIAGMNNQTALQQSLIGLQGQLAPVESRERTTNQVLGMVSPLLAQMFGLPAGSIPTGTTGGTQASAPKDATDAYSQFLDASARNLPAPQTPQEYVNRQAYMNAPGLYQGQQNPITGMGMTRTLAPQFGGSGPMGSPTGNGGFGPQLAPNDPRLVAAKATNHTQAFDPYANVRAGYFKGKDTSAMQAPLIPQNLQQQQAAAKTYQNTTLTSGRPSVNETAAAGTNTGLPGNTGQNGVPGGAGTTNASGARFPGITVQDPFNSQFTNRLKGQASAQNAKAEYGANKAATSRMAGAGFSTHSPAMASIANRNAIARSAADTNAFTGIDSQAATANASHRLEAEKAASDSALNAGLLDWRYFDSKNNNMSSLLAALLGGALR